MLLAVLVFWVIAFSSGVLILKPSIGSVKEGSPAQLSGFRPGDLVTAIDGDPVDTWEAMADRIGRSEGRVLAIAVDRPEGSVVLKVAPELARTRNLLGEEIKRYVIGIGTAGDTRSRQLGLFEAAGESLRQTYGVIELMVVIVAKLLTGGIPIDTVGGPIMIAQMAGDQAKAGIASLFQFIAVISVNLAVINLLPIPVLDGGHLLFFVIEAVKGRPVSLKVREVAQQVGMVLLGHADDPGVLQRHYTAFFQLLTPWARCAVSWAPGFGSKAPRATSGRLTWQHDWKPLSRTT